MGVKCATLQGGACFGTFMQSGLPRQTLKAVWQVVAGNASFLDQQQFVTCLYLMDLAKQGQPVPASLPSGPFPPTQKPEPTGAPKLDLTTVQQVGSWVNSSQCYFV